jgi:hypothetical protein
VAAPPRPDGVPAAEGRGPLTGDTPGPAGSLPSVPLDSFRTGTPPSLQAEGELLGNEVRMGKGAQPRWMRSWVLLLIVWALWYFFIGGQGLFHSNGPVNWFFTIVTVAWTVYHYILAPRFKWPSLPLG